MPWWGWMLVVWCSINTLGMQLHMITPNITTHKKKE